MAAVLLRLCEEDRAKYPGGDEEGWMRFDEKALDELDFNTLDSYETGLGISLEWILSIDKVAQTARWTAARVWLARKMAGMEPTPPLSKFGIKTRKVEVRDEKPVKAARKPKAADADPPSSSPSSEAEASETASV
jgi:hypothetical protein